MLKEESSHPFLFQAVVLSAGLIATLIFFGAGNSALASTPDKNLSLDDARHFLARTGFGAHPDRLSRYTGLSRTAAVEQLLDEHSVRPAREMPSWVTDAAPRYATRNEMRPMLRREFRRTRDREIADLRRWWVREMLETGSPHSERLVLFWHNHFVSGYSAIAEQSTSIARQNLLFRENALGNYEDLLKRVIRDPAMLNYLDNDNSRKQAPNENLARELMELFTLGEGHFTEEDVKNAARALTGYGVAHFHNMQFRFYPHKHDFEEKTLFGKTGNFDGDDLVELILEQPRAATYLTEKFWKAYIGPLESKTEELDNIAESFRQSGYELSTLYREILLSQAFWSPDNRAAIIKSPVDMVIGTLRSTGQTSNDWQVLPSVLSRLGQNLFEAPNVAGWPGGAAWVTPDRLLARMDWLKQLSGADCVTDCGVALALVAGNGGMMDSGSVGSVAASSNTMSMSRESGSMLEDDPSVASLRLAGEAYQGAPHMQLSLLMNGKTVWTSPDIEVRGSHDTGRFGMVESMDNMPWVIEKIRVADSADTLPEHDAVSVHFLNDDAGSSGDRNLYVDWIKLGSHTYFASNGTQESDCIPGARDRAGHLYCQGSITIKRRRQANSTASSPAEESAEHTLTVSEAQLRWVKDPERAKRGWADISFALLDAKFQGREFTTLMLRFALADDGRYAMWLDNYGCWPDCFNEWPACAHLSEHDAYFREVSIALLADEHEKIGHRQCATSDFSSEDQQLISALWQLAPELYAEARNSERVSRKPKFATAFANWEKPIREISKIAESRSDLQTPVKIVVNGQNPDRLFVVEPEALTEEVPRISGRTSRQSQQDLEKLVLSLQRRPRLAELLLATEPVVASSGESNLVLLLSDPAYQLK